MVKICQHPGCRWPAFSKGLCKMHMPKKQMSYKSNKEQSIIKVLGPETEFHSEVDMFRKVFATRMDRNGDVYCELSKDKIKLNELYKTFFYSIFIHILPKSDFPLFRLYDRNIILGLPSIHFAYDQGTLSLRKSMSDVNWKLLKKKRDQLYNEYLSYDPNAKKLLKQII